MKSFIPLATLALLIFTGCARNYVITLNNGMRLGAKGRPELKNGSYEFKDARGQNSSVAASRVASIQPASAANSSKGPGFIDSR